MGDALLVLIAALACLAGGDLPGAEQALADRRPADALELLGDLADVDEPDVRALVVQGRAYLALREYEAAVEPLLRASDRRAEDRALARDAARACWGAARGVYAAAYLEDARRMARRAGDRLLLADLFYASGDFGAALENYRAAPEAAETRVRVAMRVAQCLRGLGRDEQARAAYLRALERALAADDLRTAYRAAFAGGQTGRFLNWLDGRLERNPGDLRLRRYRGYARAALLDFAAAAQDLKPVVEADPNDLDAAHELLACLLQVGVRRQQAALLDEAEALGRSILARRADHKGAWERMVWLAGYHWSNRDVPGSYRVLRFLHKIDPGDIDTGLNFAAMARRLGHTDEARAVYLGLLEDSPDDPDVTNDLAILEDGLGRRERAVELWHRVLAAEPDNLNALENLFTAAWERGDTQRARTLVRRGLAAARAVRGPVDRWIWFRDRLEWAPRAFGGP